MSLKSCCATGSLHTGTPKGRIEKLHGLDCYIADAPNGSAKGVIVIIPDAFGWEFPNNRILADDYAKNGFQVLLPEFMDGTSPCLFYHASRH
jgi:dienelactone hydrolase